MKITANRLRREIAAIRGREPFQTRRYPAELRDAVVAFTHEERRLGRRRGRVAHELGLTEQTLAHWMRVAAPAMRPVVVAPRAAATRTREPSARPILVLVGGHRVEGLGIDELVTVVRALA